MDDMLVTAGDYVTLYGLKIIAAIIIFVVGKWLAGRLCEFTRTGLNRRGVDPALELFVSNLAFYALMAFVIIAALAQLGIQTASFIAIVGAAGLAIGLAMQGALGNFAAGFLILLFRPFKIGDYIEAAGTAGTVEKILIFNTELKTPDNKQVIIPNGQVTGGVITNYSTKDTRRVDLVIGISYRDDIDKAKQVLRDLVVSDERVLEDPPLNIAVTRLGDSSIDLIVRPWVQRDDYWGVYWDMTEAIKKRLDQEGISIPFPQRDVHLYETKKAG